MGVYHFFLLLYSPSTFTVFVEKVSFPLLLFRSSFLLVSHIRFSSKSVLKPGITCALLVHSGSLQKMLTALFNLVWITQKSKWTIFFLSAKAKWFLVLKRFSVVTSAGGSFCWNYGTDTVYGGENICCIYAGFWGGALYDRYVGGSLCCNYTGDFFCYNYVDDNFYCNYPDGSLCCNYAGGISAVDYVHDSFYCNYTGNFFFIAM